MESDDTYKKKYHGDVRTFGRVLVLFGGESSEREISIKSGKAVLKGMRERNVDAFGLDIRRDNFRQLLDIKCDRVFIALHGPGGEDGKIQAVLEWLGIPYTGSGVGSSSLAMHKVNSKRVWQNLGLPTPAFEVLSEQSDWSEVLAQLGNECFVKPVNEGSSLGMRCVSDAKSLRDAYLDARRFDNLVMAETRIAGREFSVSILHEQALPSIELKVVNEFYDYDAKYVAGTTQYLCPCELTDAQQHRITKLALNAFNALGCSGWGRVDLMHDTSGEFYLLEVNTIPGMTNQSLMPMAACAVGLDFGELLLEILATTL